MKCISGGGGLGGGICKYLKIYKYYSLMILTTSDKYHRGGETFACRGRRWERMYNTCNNVFSSCFLSASLAAAWRCCCVSAVSFLWWTGDSVLLLLLLGVMLLLLKLPIWLSNLASTPAAASRVALWALSAVFDLVYWDWNDKVIITRVLKGQSYIESRLIWKLFGLVWFAFN